jgi:hypothetical protein
MTALDVAAARRRYLLLIALRWLPTGLLIPVTVLLALSRGLTLTEIGLVFAIQVLVWNLTGWMLTRLWCRRDTAGRYSPV